MIPNSANKMVNTTIDITQYINTEYFSVNNGVAYLIKVGKLRMIKVDVTLKKQINTDVYLFNFPANFLEGMINTYFFGNLINRNGKPYEVAFYNQLASNNFSILVQVATGNTIENNSRLIGEWAGFCSADINDTSEEENKFITHNQFNILISEALKGYTKNTTLEESQAKQDELIQKLKKALINETTEQDTSIHIEDASDLPAKLEVQGNHYQETQEGTDNLAVLNEGSITQDGITVSVENGVASFSGANTSDAVTYITVGTAYLYAGQTYYMSAERQQTSGNSRLSIKLGSLVKWFTVGQEVVFECTETGEYEVRVSFGVSTVANLGTLKYLISKTSGAEWTQGKKAIPSVEYPSPIKIVGDNINILPNNFTSKTENGLDCTVNSNKSIHVVGTATATTHLILVGSVGTGTAEEVLKFKANKQYKNISNVDVLYQKTDNSYGRLLKDTEFSFETDASIRGLYLQINNGETVDETYYPKLVEYYEGMDESYSQYNQGSVEVKKINKNFYKLDIEGVSRNGVDYTVENGIVTAKRTATAESGSYLNTNRTKLPAGTYVISGVDDTFVYANARIEVYTSDTIDGNATQITTLMNTRLSYKYTSDKTFYLSFSVVITGATAVNDTFIFKSQAEKNDNDTASTFVEHQEQSYVLPIQQEMLEGDYFDLKNDKEVHDRNEVTLTGTENISINTDTDDYIEFRVNDVLPYNSKTGYNMTYSTHFSSTTNNRCASYNKDLLIRIPKPNEFTTAELFKTWLQENNVDVYYQLAEMLELDLTKEQKEVLQQLNNLDLYKGTNNIYTDQDLALLQLDYTVDTKMYIDNKIANTNAQVLNM